MVKNDIIVAVHCFFKEGRMPEGDNEMSIVLIPKIRQQEELKDFRLIILCNVMYKVVSKCMVNRLRPILDDIVSENQSVSVSGRVILDNATKLPLSASTTCNKPGI